ncbi:MAG: RluA family pseudouridine synthase [Bacteroidales bacterium]|nr:RluA family pseudouridine synthase [Bacteroidales bacterium]
MKKQTIKVETPTALLDFLMSNLSGMSRSKVKELLAHNVYVNNRRTSQFNFMLQPGMEVVIEKPSRADMLRPSEAEIVFEDHSLFVVNKRSGLLSNSTDSRDKTVISLLNDYLFATHQKCHAHIVHRLDRDTSGLMIVAKSKEVARQMEQNWKETVFDRRYTAVAWGNIEQQQGEIKSWLTDGQYCVLSSPVDNGGKLAITHFRVIQRSRRYTMLELRLDTGRRNQIRVHLREMKHPIVHDPLYGYADDISPINRLALHAHLLCFKHPVTGKNMRFENQVPKQFAKLMEI